MEQKTEREEGRFGNQSEIYIPRLSKRGCLKTVESINHIKLCTPCSSGKPASALKLQCLNMARKSRSCQVITISVSPETNIIVLMSIVPNIAICSPFFAVYSYFKYENQKN